MAGVARFVASSLAPAAQRLAPQAGGVLRPVLDIAIDGYRGFPGAETVARRYQAKHPDDAKKAVSSFGRSRSVSFNVENTKNERTKTASACGNTRCGWGEAIRCWRGRSRSASM